MQKRQYQFKQFNKLPSSLGSPAGATVAPAQPAKSTTVAVSKAAAGLELLMHVPVPELYVMAISDITVGNQILPVDIGTVEARKEALSLGEQTVPVPVRKHQDGRHDLISGYADILALKNLGRGNVLVLVISGLTDLDTQFLEIANSVHPKLSVLNRALLHARLEAVMKEMAASQHETGSQTNRDLSVRKIAEHLGFGKDVVLRSRKMARIHPDVHRDIRDAKFDDNQKALLEISDAGETAAEQLAKLQELLEQRSRAKQNRAKPRNTLAPVNAVIAGPEMPRNECPGEMPEIPDCLRRNPAKVNYEQVKDEWRRCHDLILALDPEDRQRLIVECVAPFVEARQFGQAESSETCHCPTVSLPAVGATDEG